MARKAAAGATTAAYTPRSVRIIAVPIDLGASRRGTDAGPSAMRVAGLNVALERLGHRVAVDIDIDVPAMETRDEKCDSARFLEEILIVSDSPGRRGRRSMPVTSRSSSAAITRWPWVRSPA